MKLNEYILRNKSLSILNPPSNKMTIELYNPKSNIIDAKGTSFHLYKEIKLKILENDSKRLIADFSIGLQSEVLVEEKEEFSDVLFNEQIMPIFYVYLSEMISELKLPQISFSYFSELFMKK